MLDRALDLPEVILKSMKLTLTQSNYSNFWRGKKVLITGHTGFKGSWLALWLSELGAKLTGVGLEPNTEPSLFRQLLIKDRLQNHFVADIRNIADLEKIVEASQPDIALHLAAQPLVGQSYIDPLGTWETNLQGSLNLLQCLKRLKHNCAVVMVTTDKVYANQEWEFGYRETDQLGGHDPYSASKAAAELAISSWRASFIGTKNYQTPYLAIATARAGNVIGGGDWAANRLVPDGIRALIENKTIQVRNPKATRPWQHVLEPLSGYLLLAERLASEPAIGNRYADAFNFGPTLEANKSVEDLTKEILINWKGSWENASDAQAPHEAGRLHLQIDKVHHQLGWKPRWNFSTTVEKTIRWYQSIQNGGSATQSCLADLEAYVTTKPNTTISAND